MLEIAGREADGGCRCVSVGCGTAQAGPPLDLRCKPTRAAASSQARVEYRLSVCRCGGRGTKRAPLWRAVCTCALVVLVGGLSIRPVLKHGPRSLTCVRVGGFENLRGARKLTGEIPSLRGVHRRPTLSLCEGFECEHTCWDPKDGELCLSRAKPEETLVEARSDTDVQIVRLTWV